MIDWFKRKYTEIATTSVVAFLALQVFLPTMMDLVVGLVCVAIMYTTLKIGRR